MGTLNCPSNARLARLAAGALLVFWLGSSTTASELVDLQPLTERVLMLHFNDGHVQHHRRGEPRSAEKVFTDPLDVVAAARAESYTVTSADDPAYRQKRVPLSVGRKSKGTDFAWFVDKWEDGRAVNNRPDHTKEHWLYLELPTAMQEGRTYTVGTGGLARNGTNWTLKFDLAHARSEAVHVNTLGYVPGAPEKYAYVYHWMGDRGSLDLAAWEGRPFHLVETNTGTRVFSGQVHFRMSKTNAETFHKADSPPFGNFLGADVWQCDFSKFERPGIYVVAVEGVGCSWPFRIDPDVYRPAFVTVARALYHNRSGIALQRPYTEFERPAPHHSKLTPGFAGKLRYTRVRWQEWGGEGGEAKKLMAESPGALNDTWGWYQDAGDWDSYYTHLRVAQELLLVYEMGPRKFRDQELNLPESGNGVPDILDEAAWLPRFCQRLRAELQSKGWGSGGVGLRVAGDAFGNDEKTLPDGRVVGQGSWEDVGRTWVVSGEDPWSTYRYAGTAAHLAYTYELAGDGQGLEQGVASLFGLDHGGEGEVGLVNRHLLDDGARGHHQSHDLAGFFLVAVHAGAHEDALGTEPPGRDAGHGRAHAEAAGLVTGRADHAALVGRRADDDGPAPQCWVVPLLDRSVEGIHVQTQDDPVHRQWHSASLRRSAEASTRGSRFPA